MTVKTFVAAGAVVVLSLVATFTLAAPASAQERPYFKLYDVETHPGTQTNSTAFEQALFDGYTTLSDDRHAGWKHTDWDFADAELFKHKARSAMKGSDALPDTPLDRDLSDEQDQTFWQALRRLRDGFHRGGREQTPGPMATAQVSYDCWIEATEAGRGDDADRCKSDFESAMAAVESGANYHLSQIGEKRAMAPAAAAPAAQPSSYLVYFDFDSSEILPDGRAALDDAIRDAQADPGKQVHLVAHADRSGPEAYNQALSERRATAVITELVIGGIDRTRVVSEAVGETRPMVATADGAREPGNRVVEIDLR